MAAKVVSAASITSAVFDPGALQPFPLAPPRPFAQLPRGGA